MNSKPWLPGQLINLAQTTFVGLLRVLSIPIVLMLSVASGYTTYFGLSYFIIPWIALVITIAVQAIMVICALELASMHWRANALRFLLVTITLLVSVAVSVSFSYFKFYEISEKESIELERLANVKKSIDAYLKQIFDAKAALVKEQQQVAEQARQQAHLAFLGTHPDIEEKYRNHVGRGRVWSQFNRIHQAELAKVDSLAAKFQSLADQIAAFRMNLNKLGEHTDIGPEEYQTIVAEYAAIQSAFEKIMSDNGHSFPSAPMLAPYAEFHQVFKPSFAMWRAFSWFAFACAVIVDLFAVILSYRLEFTAPGPLTFEEQELAYQCLKEFKDLRINQNDELEFALEKSELERARKYSDWNRSFGAAYLLNRGYLRKVDDQRVEFAPNLYPIIAARLGTSVANPSAVSADRPLGEEIQRKFKESVTGHEHAPQR